MITALNAQLANSVNNFQVQQYISGFLNGVNANSHTTQTGTSTTVATTQSCQHYIKPNK